MADDTTQEHGPEVVCYSNGPLGLRPFVQCLCGWSTYEDTWQEIGEEFDIHLAEVKGPMADEIEARAREFHQTAFGMGTIEELAAFYRAQLVELEKSGHLRHGEHCDSLYCIHGWHPESIASSHKNCERKPCNCGYPLVGE